MSIGQLSISDVSLRQALAEGVPENTDHRRCDHYSGEYAKLADSLDASGRGEVAAACRFFGALASLRLKLDDPSSPFVPSFTLQHARSPALDDFADVQLEHLYKVLADISDAELRARAADVLWLRRRDHTCARNAVTAYVESAKVLLGDSLACSSGIERFERALQLGAKLGSGQPLFEKAVRVVDDIASDMAQTNYVSASCLGLILRFNKNDPERFARISDSRATDAGEATVWRRRFLELGVAFYRRAGMERDANRCGIEIAKSFEDEAAVVLGKDSSTGALTAAHFITCAIQAYRRVPGTETERERLHLQLVEIQKTAGKAIPRFKSDPVDVSELQRSARNMVRGKSLKDALRILASAPRCLDFEKLHSEAEADICRHPLAFVFPASTLSGTGKVVAKQGNMSAASPTDRESLVVRQMYWRLQRVHWPWAVIAWIEPMRDQIVEEHYARYADLWPVLQCSSLIPQGREYFFLRALCAGLHADFFESLHILIPQLENSFRSLLAESGVITSTLDHNGVQQEQDLNALLYEPRMTELFGKGVIFELRGLLVEKASSNFRNQLAHGMLEYGEFVDTTAVYIWWFALRLCILSVTPGAPDDSAAS
jgi:Domain of unknown function (DUF4209)